MARRKKRQSKFNSIRVKSEDGQLFDSTKEYARYLELKEMERKGLIWNLRRQVTYQLLPAVFEEVPVQLKHKMGKKKVSLFRPTNYRADFVYYVGDEEVVEDVKSTQTIKDPVYKIKKKLMYMIHHIKIKETI